MNEVDFYFIDYIGWSNAKSLRIQGAKYLMINRIISVTYIVGVLSERRTFTKEVQFYYKVVLDKIMLDDYGKRSFLSFLYKHVSNGFVTAQRIDPEVLVSRQDARRMASDEDKE